MHRRGDDVRRRFAGQLDNVLAEIGLDRLDAGSGQRFIELRLFREHRLRLGRLGHAMAARHVDHQIANLLAITRPQHLGTAGFGLHLENI
jgi:hypothetical protein